MGCREKETGVSERLSGAAQTAGLQVVYSNQWVKNRWGYRPRVQIQYKDLKREMQRLWKLPRNGAEGGKEH